MNICHMIPFQELTSTEFKGVSILWSSDNVISFLDCIRCQVTQEWCWWFICDNKAYILMVKLKTWTSKNSVTIMRISSYSLYLNPVENKNAAMKENQRRDLGE